MTQMAEDEEKSQMAGIKGGKIKDGSSADEDDESG
jgi:general stress protein YciG